MELHHIRITKTARYAMLGALGGDLRQVWFVCHGYGHLAADFIVNCEVLNDGSRIIVAPEALSRFYHGSSAGTHPPSAKVGASWMTREDRESEIEDYVGYLDALYDHIFERVKRSSVEVHALGFSQGAAAACRWTVMGRAGVNHLILWAGTVPPDLDLSAAGKKLEKLSVTLVYGTRDEMISPDRVSETEKRFRDVGIHYRLRRFEGGHHLASGELKSLAG